MKAPPFAYACPNSLAGALTLLARHGEQARVLAGGQSLVAALNMRLSAPDLLIDISRLAALSGIRSGRSKLTIGALTTHAEIGRSEEIRRRAPLLAQAVPHIAHPAIRNVGTIGGSLALADPAAEWPACCVALDAKFALASKTGKRMIAARDFFKGPYATALRPKEILTHVEVPVLGADYRSAFVELSLRRGDYAIVGLAAVARVARGALFDLRLAFLGVEPAPVLARKAMAAMEGRRATDAAVAAAALEQDLDPAADLYSSAATKLQLARVLTARALTALAA